MELRLPSEYQEVEYIENTGTQYIITDLLFPEDLENPKIEWGFMHIGSASGDNMVFGYTNRGAVYFEIYGYIEQIYGGTGQKRYRAIVDNNLAKNILITGLMTKETITLNGTSHASNDNYSRTQDALPMAIFAWKTTSGVNYINKGARIYYLRFFDGNTKMADYVPCYRKLDGEIGMYDTVTKMFYTNSGEGTFLKGADITRYIDNVSVLDTRRKILLNTPHIDTSVGDLVTFNTDLNAPLKSCKVSFLPVQEGEGDPSPNNVRNITGWNGVSVTHTNEDGIQNLYSVDWTDSAGTVYGGYVDLVSGELVATHLAFVMDGVNHKVSTGAGVNTNNNMARGHAFMGRTGGLENVPLGKNNSGLYAVDKYVIHGMKNGGDDTAVEGVYCGTGTPYIRVVVSVDDLADVSGANAIISSINEWLTNNPVQVCYTLAEPIHYQLTPQQILALKGTNNVYSDTNGQTEIKYWAH